jgi:hypothetical protein
MTADVLVVGGGPAATWSAVAAPRPVPQSFWSTRVMSGQAAQPRRPIPAHGRHRRANGGEQQSRRASRALEIWPIRHGLSARSKRLGESYIA